MQPQIVFLPRSPLKLHSVHFLLVPHVHIKSNHRHKYHRNPLLPAHPRNYHLSTQVQIARHYQVVLSQLLP